MCKRNRRSRILISIWHIKKSRNRNNNNKSENEKDTEKYFEIKHGPKISCDKFIEDVKDEIYDLIICCWGHPNSVILGKNETLVEMLKNKIKKVDWFLQFL